MKPIVDGLKNDLKGKADFMALNLDDPVGETLASKFHVPPGGFVIYDGEGKVFLTLDLPHKKQIMKAVERSQAKEEGREYFNRVAVEWDKLREQMFSDRVRELVVRESGLLPESVVLDLGCGTGFLSKAFIGIAHKVIGVDSSEEMLAQARNHLHQADNFETRLGTADRIPVEKGVVDLVVGNMILHHCPNPISAIEEMVRVLKPGGRLILTDLDKHSHDWLREEHKDIWLGFEREDLKKRFELAGLSEVEIKDTQESCSTSSVKGEEIEVSIFLASGTKGEA